MRSARPDAWLLSLLARTPPFASLPKMELEALVAGSRLRRFATRETIYGEDEPAAAAWLLVSGRVKILGFAGSDRLMTLETIVRGQLFGLFCRLGSQARCYPCTAVAEGGPVVALRVPDQLFLRLYERFPQVTRATCELCAGRLRRLRALLPFSRKSVEQRVLETLLAHARTNGNELTLTRPQLAQRVGAATETVFRILARLRRDGLVETSPGLIRLVDPAGLARRLEASAA